MNTVTTFIQNETWYALREKVRRAYGRDFTGEEKTEIAAAMREAAGFEPVATPEEDDGVTVDREMFLSLATTVKTPKGLMVEVAADGEQSEATPQQFMRAVYDTIVVPREADEDPDEDPDGEADEETDGEAT